jgi:hypothetical protein
MVTGWYDLLMHVPSRNKREFVSVDARLDDLKKDTRSYEMLSRDSGKTMDDIVTSPVVTPLSPIAKSSLRSPRSPSTASNGDYANYYNNLVTQDNRIAGTIDGRRTPDYFGQTARYHTPARSFSSPKPPQTVTWDSRDTYAPQGHTGGEGDAEGNDNKYVNPLGMNRF